MKRSLPLLTAGVVLGCVLAAGIGGPAVAGDVSGLTKPEIMASLMKTSDIPAAVITLPGEPAPSTAPSRTTSYLTGSEATGPDLCKDSGGEDVRGPVPHATARASIDLGSSGTTDNDAAANNQVFHYVSASVALRAWTELVTTAQTCAGTVTYETTLSEATVDVSVTTAFKRTAPWRRVRGFTLMANVSVDVDVTGVINLDILADKYSAYRLVGPTIERVEFARVSLNGSNVDIDARRLSFVRVETDRVAARLWNYWRT